MKYTLDLLANFTNQFWRANFKFPNVLYTSPKMYRWLSDMFIEQAGHYGEDADFQEELGSPWTFRVSGMKVVEDPELKENQISLGRVQTFEINEEEG